MKNIAIIGIVLLFTTPLLQGQHCHAKTPNLLEFVKAHATELACHIKRSKKKLKKTAPSAPSKEELAFTTVKEAAEDGYVPAQDLLAYCYATGTGTKVNGKLAFCWYLCAALGGSQSAKESLIACFDEGIGIAKDAGIARALRALLLPS